MLNKEKLSKIANSERFIFGAATSSFQIEGGYDQGGRSPSIWDDFCLEDGRVKGKDDGRIGVNHYECWREDLKLLKDLNFDAYRFSLSWSRVFPERGQVNQEGLDFYRDIIDELNRLEIKAYITLYHWDLPSYLEERGGWINRETAYAFAEYAKLIAQEFGDKVESIATLNEPLCSAYCGYLWGVHAPGYRDRRMAFQASHHLLLAHGLGMRELRQHSPNTKNGIVINFTPAYAAPESKTSQLAMELADFEQNYRFTDALFLGEYPKQLIECSPDSKPCIFPGDMELIKEPVDFLGVNYYTRHVVDLEKDFYKVLTPKEPRTDIGWEVFSQGLYELIKSKLSRYQDLPPIYITENGAAFNDGPDDSGEINDQRRLEYYEDHLGEINRLVEEGIDIRGYFAWSLLDNFEWAEGFSQRFGIVHVDFDTLKRTPKLSGLGFKEFLGSRMS